MIPNPDRPEKMALRHEGMDSNLKKNKLKIESIEHLVAEIVSQIKVQNGATKK